MSRLRLVMLSALIVALLASVLPLTALAQLPPALYRCTVYVDGELAGAGLTVKAYVGTEADPRAGAEAVTSADGVAIIQVPITPADLGPPAAAISFTVDDVAATETPDVDVTLAGPDVRLDVGAVAPFDPWTYDTDVPYGELSKAEVLVAINDYFDETIDKDQVLQVVILYFS